MLLLEMAVTHVFFEQLIYKDDWEDLCDIRIAAMDKYRVFVAQGMCCPHGPTGA
jgi:hypothetical protein